MDLVQALRLKPEPRLALVGAGGKTTALFEIAHRLPSPVLITATTHLAQHQLTLADHHFILLKPEDLAPLEANLPGGVTLLTGPASEVDRVAGLDTLTLERIKGLADAYHIPLLIEADGSRQRPVKAPGEHEPSIPLFVDTVLVVAGLSALGKPLSSEWVHRPDQFADLSGLSPGEIIIPEALANVLTHTSGGLKNIPPGAKRIALLNQADTPELQAQGQSLAAMLLPDYASVVIASLASSGVQGESSVPGLAGVVRRNGGLPQVFAVYEPVAGIVLAAGESHRFGQPKQLLTWKGETFIHHIVRTTLQTGLSAVVVVIGAHAEEVRAAIQVRYPVDTRLSLVDNPDWQYGQSTSVQKGLQALPAQTGAAVFFLVDQPQIPTTLVRALVELHSQTLSPIIAPLIDGQRGNPVMFDRVTFGDLLSLTGDTGGRALFSRYPVMWLPWHDPSLLLDVDTPEDYQKLLSMETE
jgi:molybdenum cofactor cytidylyltransferase